MRQSDKDKAASWPSTGQMEKLRGELRKRITREELECTLRLTAVGHLIRALNVDLVDLRRFWGSAALGGRCKLGNRIGLYRSISLPVKLRLDH